jgi:hypothetical protein
MTDLPQRSWRFAPTGGGAEQGNNPGQQYFANDAVTKMVRELLQNSLDHPEPGIDTVHVNFKLITLSPDDIAADQLKHHIQASLEEVRHNQDPDTTEHYQRMLTAISGPAISCLAITDSGTTGLQHDNWRNLIFREGTPTNTGGQTKGGSFGFGKNAPFNLSDCNTVIYSTRYTSRRARGRVQRMTGRSQLVTHDDPVNPTTRLQNTGFLAVHQPDQLNQPIQGPQVPEPFTLTEAGTGVFVVAFDTRRYHNWADLTAQATVTQFFHAILNGHLVVTIEQQQGKTRTIAQDTLEIELDGLPPQDPTRYYVQAVQEDTPQLTSPSGRLGQMGQLKVWINTTQGAPRRTAHVNRRGMLITQERRFGSNPFYPSGGTGWPNWCAVTVANDEDADRFIRRLEPPAHDAIHHRQLRHPEEQRAAETELRQQRDEITRMVRERIQDTMKDATQNVEELADLFPDLPDLSQGTHDLKWRTRITPETPDNTVNTADESDDADPQDDPDGDIEREGQPPPEAGGGGGGGPNTFTDPETRPASPSQSESTMRDARIMRTSPRSADEKPWLRRGF